MKKLLLASVAIGGLAMASTAAHADVELEVGGYFKGYGVFIDQDDNADTDGGTAGVQGAGNVNENFDFIRDTEIHIGGETVLDNGLTVGAHFELDTDTADSSTLDESYVYFSGNWGRVNFGGEDGAGYLLQVAAPSADSNIDGIRQYVQPVNYGAAVGDSNASGGTADELVFVFGGGLLVDGVDYDMDLAFKNDKLTYLSPVFSGFQVGASYTPDSNGPSGALGGVGFDDVVDTFGQTYELALRYEGQFDNVGVIFGAGWAQSELEQSGTTAAPVAATDVAVGDPTDDRTAWNVGLDLDIGAFGIGAIYMEDDKGELTATAPTALAAAVTGDDEETMVLGVDYTHGQFKLGASWMDQDNTLGVEDLDTERLTGGVVYEYGPGMSFRGSISHIEHDATGLGGPGQNEIESTSFVLGTQINF